MTGLEFLTSIGITDTVKATVATCDTQENYDKLREYFVNKYGQPELIGNIPVFTTPKDHFKVYLRLEGNISI